MLICNHSPLIQTIPTHLLPSVSIPVLHYITGIPGLSQELKEVYKTVWEIRQKSLIDLAADR